MAGGLKLSMIITERDDYRQMMVLMQDQLKRVGVDVELNKVDHAFYHSQIVKHVNPLILFGDISYPNTEILLTRAFRTGATRNFSGFSDPAFDELLDKIAASPSLDGAQAAPPSGAAAYCGAGDPGPRPLPGNRSSATSVSIWAIS